MGSRFRSGRQAISVFLCAQLLLPMLSQVAWAKQRVITGDTIVTMEIGQPSVWSLAQAHYFLAQMHKNNSSLATKTPDANALDPNQADSSRLETVQKFFGLEAKFDQAAAAKNQAALQTFRDQTQRRDQARADLEVRKADLAKAKADQEALDEQIATLTTEDQLADAARGKAPVSPADGKRKADLAVLKVREAAQKDKVDSLTAEVSSLSTKAAADIAAPAVSTDIPTNVPTDLPGSALFTAFATNAMNGLANPRLSASITLDNFVGMQYEIIAKQLSLLRDEVGPDERVIFLELPTSIYTVDKWADDYVAQVKWKVTEYYDQEPDLDIQNDEICEQLENAGRPTHSILDAIQSNSKTRNEPCVAGRLGGSRSMPCVAREMARGNLGALPWVLDAGNCADLSKRSPLDDSDQKYPITMSMIERQIKRGSGRSEDNPGYIGEVGSAMAYAKIVDAQNGQPRALHIRALEIIPHQSAINVNESTAAVHGRFFQGLLGLLNGLGLDIVARSQSELYQRFVQQEVFASGFGKGSAEFGWTFGPQPGTKRITPGQRTTYAVLAVPKNTLAITLEASGQTFKRRQSPDRSEPLQTQHFLVGIPGERTEQFFVDGIDYAPMPKGGSVTALIEGRFFSPQLGVLVDGFPLRRALSITRAGGDETPGTPSSSGIDGEFEITNSREIALHFSMGKDFVGTPSITLVSPERSNGINRFALELNHSKHASLQEESQREPMFVDAFGPDLKIDKLSGEAAPACECMHDTLIRARLQGTGLRPAAQISINGHVIPVEPLEASAKRKIQEQVEEQIKKKPCRELAVQETTNSYFLYLKDPGDDWKVRYVQPTGRGFDVKEFDQPFGKPFAATIRHYLRGRDGRPSRIFLSLSGDKEITDVQLIEPQGGPCPGPAQGEDGTIQVTCSWTVRRGEPQQDFLTIQAKGKKTHLLDIDLPVRPRIAVLKNPRTGKPSGYADEQPVVFGEGSGLRNVTGVLFGDQAAKLTSTSDAEVLTIQVPKIELAQGEAKEVPVILQLKDGQKVPSGASYLFLGAPLPKLLVCGGSPCPPRPHDPNRP